MSLVKQHKKVSDFHYYFTRHTSATELACVSPLCWLNNCYNKPFSLPHYYPLTIYDHAQLPVVVTYSRVIAYRVVLLVLHVGVE